MIKVIKIDTDELKNCKDPMQRLEKIIKEIEAEMEQDNKACCNNCSNAENSESVPTLAKQCTTCMYAHVCKHAEEASNIEEFVNERCKDYPDVFAWYYDCKLYEVDSKKVKRQDNIDVEK